MHENVCVPHELLDVSNPHGNFKCVAYLCETKAPVTFDVRIGDPFGGLGQREARRYASPSTTTEELWPRRRKWPLEPRPDGRWGSASDRSTQSTTWPQVRRVDTARRRDVCRLRTHDNARFNSSHRPRASATALRPTEIPRDGFARPVVSVDQRARFVSSRFMRSSSRDRCSACRDSRRSKLVNVSLVMSRTLPAGCGFAVARSAISRLRRLISLPSGLIAFDNSS